MVKNTAYCGDCLELMPVIPARSINMVLCDLPYGTTGLDWDKRLPIQRLWQQYERIITEAGVIVLFASQPYSSFLVSSNIKIFKYDWIWIKNNGTGFQHAKNRPLKYHEDILVFSPGSMGHKNLLGNKRMSYKPIGLIRTMKVHKTSARKHTSIIGWRPSHKDAVVQEYSNYPRTVLQYPVERGLHPTQKPVALVNFLIETYTEPSGTVLDNCSGSGTTGVACIKSHRQFILMEKHRPFYDKSIERLKQHASVVDVQRNSVSFSF